MVAQCVTVVVDGSLIAFLKLRDFHNIIITTFSTSNEDIAVGLGTNLELSKSIQSHARSLLPTYMIPKRIFVVANYPTTPNGKIDRKKMAALPMNSLSAADDEHLSVSLLKGVSYVDTHIAYHSSSASQLKAMNSLTGKQQILNRAKVGTIVESESKLTTIVPQIGQSLSSLLCDLVFKVSGQSVSPNSSFSVVGIDSLTAIVFQSLVSTTLGGVYVDVSELYDYNSTIESFSESLFEKLRVHNPDMLFRMRIVSALDVRVSSEVAVGLDSVTGKSSNFFLSISINVSTKFIPFLR